MTYHRPPLVTDANVRIDLHTGRVCTVTVSLPYDWIAPDLVLAELQREPSDRRNAALGVRSVSLTGEHVAQIPGLRAAYPGVSVADLSALVLARALGCTLLTGDHLLRRAAEREGIEVHGTLWQTTARVCVGER